MLAATISTPYQMTNLIKHILSLQTSCKTVLLAFTIQFFVGCNTHSKDANKNLDTQPKTAPESLHFTAHIIENHDDGSRGEIDTITG
jgi:hypothetical protein